ncbi:hypothetical protein M0R45_006912 [Rubus argutus]|uniref:F-box domain-containing protein n=1 Tax=Rubus argutus TaxID=59490 RepID=A0AAW1YRV0_RUBAR
MAKRQCCGLSSSSAKLMVIDLYREHIPLDIFINIFSRLPAESVCCIRCVCKTMLDTVDNCSFVTLHTRSLVNATNGVTHVPQLMFFTLSCNPPGHLAALHSLKYDGGNTLTKGKHAVSVFTSKDYDLSRYTVDFVFCNLFCLRNIRYNKCGHCFLVNPLMGEVLRLPTSNVHGTNFRFRDWYGMGIDSSTGTYKIVRVSKFCKENVAGEFLVAQVFELGTSSWREIPSVPPCQLNTTRCVSAYGDMHWLFIKVSEKICQIVSFDFKKEEFYSAPHPGFQGWNHSHLVANLHLITLRGSLATVDSSSSTGVTMNIEIWVLKDYDKKEWTRDYTINIEMIGLHPNFRSIDIICGEWEHGIFLKNMRRCPTYFFLDLNRVSMKIATFGGEDICRIYSYTKSLISLKDYGNILEAETGSGSLKCFGQLIEGEAEGFSLSEQHMLLRRSFI